MRAGYSRESKHQAEPMRVEDASPVIVTKSRFRRVAKLLKSRSRRVSNPPRVASSYLLSGLVKCRECGGSHTGQAAKRLGVSRKQLSDLVNGHSGISPEMAMRFDRALGGDANARYRLRAAYDFAQTMRRADQIKVERITTVA